MPPAFQHLKSLFPKRIAPVQVTAVSGVMTPDSRPAAAMAILKVEPGGKAFWIARFVIGNPPWSRRRLQRLLEMPAEKSFGLNAGRLTIARTSPEGRSRATTAPGRSPSDSSAARWTARSSVSWRSSPASARAGPGGGSPGRPR